MGGVDSRPPRVSVVCSNTIGKVRTSSSSSEGRSWICRCRCGESDSPVLPTAAIRCPRVTDWPGRTSALPCWRCSKHDVAPTADVEDDRVAFALAELADRLLSEVVADAHDGAIGRCQHRLTEAVPGRVVLGVTREGLAIDQPGEVEGIAHVRMRVVVAQQGAAAAGYHRPLTLQRHVDGHRCPRRGKGGCSGRRQGRR